MNAGGVLNACKSNEDPLIGNFRRVLKWVVKVVAAVATTIVVLGLLVFAAWLFLGRQNRSSK